ncbi:hypothetical protein [Shewanella algae]|uniref:hypothetical protein n=1 Tax=Shewanella algae TaxID=38313 RepID=UPI0008F82817|nr:hypothetical protein BFS86_09025 [Shewanella algae]
MSKERDYKEEYRRYDGLPHVKKKRAQRNKARRLMMRLGLVKKGDGKDVDHKDRNVFNNSRSNLRVQDASVNRGRNK